MCKVLWKHSKSNDQGKERLLRRWSFYARCWRRRWRGWNPRKEKSAHQSLEMPNPTALSSLERNRAQVGEARSEAGDAHGIWQCWPWRTFRHLGWSWHNEISWGQHDRWVCVRGKGKISMTGQWWRPWGSRRHRFKWISNKIWNKGL